ncbi:hypothetical protein K4749_15140 [Streptomyces sp. TRM72054]|uniref:hypothetical protein n=1 Tax=Streptomyces sp. TRM72054 TaxID=2870562 RepID=UPI001C8B2D44|nr:hypothetical protein [Streptomyces sp. TRM72054]MBX9394899.1 hypothetical protein [Streptomyces sp. TRM72054]
MRSKLPQRAHRAIAVSAAAVVTTAALVVALAPEASAAAAPLPIAGAGGEPLVNVDGHIFAQPLVNNLTLPTLK